MKLRGMTVLKGWLLAACAAAALGCGVDVVEGDDPPAACEDFADEAPGDGVTVRFRNARTENIFLGAQSGCGEVAPFQVLDASGASLPFQLSGCGFNCEDLQQHDGICAADCALPPVYYIEPGGVLDLAWDGRVVETVDMPGSCFHLARGGDSECEQRAVAAAGDYTLAGQAFLQAENCDYNGSTQCACAPTPDGSCRLDGPANVAGAPIAATGALSYPDQGVVEIVFQ